MNVSDIVVNCDGWIGRVLEIVKGGVKMEYEKCGKMKVEVWDSGSVRLADVSEIEEFVFKDDVVTKKLKEGFK